LELGLEEVDDRGEELGQWVDEGVVSLTPVRRNLL